MPRNFHWSRSSPVINLRLADIGTPFTSLNELMVDSAPASNAALNGGR